jgi:hypothetical protein
MCAPRRTGEEIAKEICRGRRQLREPALQLIRILANYTPKMELRNVRILIENARKAREATDLLQGLLRSLEQEELIRGWPSLVILGVGWLHSAGELRATITQLERTRHCLHWWERLRTADPRIGDIQKLCAYMTLGLIDDGLPISELRRVASLLYEAATGKQNMDLKRACVRARKKWDASRKDRTKASQTV